MTWLRIAIVALAFLATAAGLIPLRFVMENAPLRDRRIDPGFASGTVWSGMLEGVKWSGTPLGDFKIAASPVALLTGNLRVRFASSGLVREGEWIVGRRGERFEKLTGLIQLNQLAPGAPSGAFVSFLNVSTRIGSTGCRDIDGRVLVDGLSEAGFPAMEGSLVCSDGRVVLRLASESAPPLDLIVDTETGAISSRSADPAALAALASIGIAVEPSEPQ